MDTEVSSAHASAVTQWGQTLDPSPAPQAERVHWQTTGKGKLQLKNFSASEIVVN